MNHKQRVTIQIVCGVIVMLLLTVVLWLIVPDPDTTDRHGYVFSSTVLFSVPLIFGVHTALFIRFNSDVFILGYIAEIQPEFIKAYLDNTVEQTLVNLTTAITLGMVAPITFIKLVPIQAMVFIVARLIYFFSYRRDPMKRFLGFVAGYYIALASMFASFYWAFMV